MCVLLSEEELLWLHLPASSFSLHTLNCTKQQVITCTSNCTALTSSKNCGVMPDINVSALLTLGLRCENQ